MFAALSYLAILPHFNETASLPEEEILFAYHLCSFPLLPCAPGSVSGWLIPWIKGVRKTEAGATLRVSPLPAYAKVRGEGVSVSTG